MESMEHQLNEAEIRTRKRLINAMGSSILEYLADTNVLELAVNTDQRLWIDTFDRGWVDTGHKVLPSIAKQIIYGVAAMADTVIDVENKPYLEAEMKPWEPYCLNAAFRRSFLILWMCPYSISGNMPGQYSPWMIMYGRGL